MLKSVKFFMSHLLRHCPIATLYEGRSLKLDVGALSEAHTVCDPSKHFWPATKVIIDAA